MFDWLLKIVNIEKRLPTHSLKIKYVDMPKSNPSEYSSNIEFAGTTIFFLFLFVHLQGPDKVLNNGPS